MDQELSEDQVEAIRKDFGACSEETVEAIVRFRRSNDPNEIPAIVRGIVERYLPEESKETFRNATDETPLENLNVDSLAMLEIVLDIQDAVDIVIDDSEIREFTTLGDVRSFLESKVQGAN